jgi:hypothetical protein
MWTTIDEYDFAAIKAYMEFKDKKVSELFRRIFEQALKHNVSIWKRQF